jgi:hypothetical protein
MADRNKGSMKGTDADKVRRMAFELSQIQLRRSSQEQSKRIGALRSFRSTHRHVPQRVDPTFGNLGRCTIRAP